MLKTKNEIGVFHRNADYMIETDVIAPTNEKADATMVELVIASRNANGKAYFDDIEFVDVTS